MSLNFQYYGKSDTKKWDKGDWNTYNALVWFTMAVDIGYLYEGSAEEFVRRVNAQQLAVDAETKKVKVLEAKEIEQFYGLKTNVQTLTAGQWAKKHFSNRGEAAAAWVAKVNKAAYADGVAYEG